MNRKNTAAVGHIYETAVTADCCVYNEYSVITVGDVIAKTGGRRGRGNSD